MLVATFEADRVVGLGGAFHPEVVREVVVQDAVRTNGTPEAMVHVRHTCAWRPGGKLPCASATYSTHVAGNAFSRRIPYRGPGTYVSA